MRVRIVDAFALRAVQPLTLIAYAHAQGWKRSGTYRGHSGIFRDGSGAELILPESLQLGDYSNVVSDVIALLSRREDRSEVEVFRDLVTSDRDVIRVRSPQADGSGSVQIDSGISIFSEAKAMLEAAACAASSPRAIYRAGSVKEASQYMERVKLGQTEQGSFVATLLAPVPPLLSFTEQAAFWPDLEEEPYERLVTRGLASSLSEIVQVADGSVRGESSKAIDASVAHGASANMYEALSGLATAGGGVGVAITWARTRPTPERRSEVSFSQSSADVFTEAARLLRQREPRPDIRLLGFVTNLNRGPNVTEGRVTIKAILDGKIVSAFATLDGEQYQRAVRAHERQISVSVVGDLARRRERWFLESPRDMQLLEGGE